MAAYETRVGVHTMKFTKPIMALLSIEVLVIKCAVWWLVVKWWRQWQQWW